MEYNGLGKGGGEDTGRKWDEWTEQSMVCWILEHVGVCAVWVGIRYSS